MAKYVYIIVCKDTISGDTTTDSSHREIVKVFSSSKKAVEWLHDIYETLKCIPSNSNSKSYCHLDDGLPINKMWVSYSYFKDYYDENEGRNYSKEFNKFWQVIPMEVS